MRTCQDNEDDVMADDTDITSARTEIWEEAGIAAVREAAARIPKGVEGDCFHCGEHTLRLVRSACAPCRDRLGLP